MKRTLAIFALLVAACERRPSEGGSDSSRAAGGSAPLDGSLQSGDLIFHESTSRQSAMVRALTRGRWTHMGVLFVEPSGTVVLEAASPVRHTPFDRFTARGRGGGYVIKRLRDRETALSADAVASMRSLAKSWLGRPYDSQFRWGDDALYCSELAYKLFDRGARIQIGRIERAEDMNLEHRAVKRALSARFAKGKFDPSEPVVTPASIFDDERWVTVLER